jgi:hypothetical protein
MVPKKGTALFSVARVAHIIDGMVGQHSAPLTTVRIVAGGTADLHVAQLRAKQVGGTLEKRLSLFDVTSETSLFNVCASEHVQRQSTVKNLRDLGLTSFVKVQRHSLDQFGMVDAVTRQAAHVPSIMLATNPFTMSALTPVTHETGLICLGSADGGWINRARCEFCLSTGLGVLIAVAVAGLTLRAPRVTQEPGALTVSVKRKRLHDQPVALFAVFANYGLLSCGCRRCLSYKIRRFCFSSRFVEPDGSQTDSDQSKKDPWNESSFGS